VIGINALIVNPLITELIFSFARYSVKLSINVNEANIVTKKTVYMIKTKVAFWKASFYPANQNNLKRFQKALIGWKKAGPLKKPLLR